MCVMASKYGGDFEDVLRFLEKEFILLSEVVSDIEEVLLERVFVGRLKIFRVFYALYEEFKECV